jgi:PKD repeat protein
MQLISANWIDQATQNQVPTDIPVADTYRSDADNRGTYGYHWGVNGIRPDGTRRMPESPPKTYYTAGYNDNYLFIVPEWKMVFVRLGLDKTINDSRQVFNDFFRIIGEGITSSGTSDVTAGHTYADAGTYSVELTVTDDGGATDTASQTITVSSVNDPPVAADDSYTTDKDTPLTVAAPGVLSNDTDANGDSLTAALVNDVTNGTLALNADGSFSYTPVAGFTGDASFTYKAYDGTEYSAVATVTITVNEVNVPTSLHVGDLSSTARSVKKFWKADVKVTVLDANENPVGRAVVSGIWSDGTSDSCTTDATNGQCVVKMTKISNSEVEVTFTVSDVTHDTLSYEPNDNIETQIIVYKP